MLFLIEMLFFAVPPLPAMMPISAAIASLATMELVFFSAVMSLPAVMPIPAVLFPGRVSISVPVRVLGSTYVEVTCVVRACATCLCGRLLNCFCWNVFCGVDWYLCHSTFPCS